MFRYYIIAGGSSKFGVFILSVFLTAATLCSGQTQVSWPGALSAQSFRTFSRAKMNVPEGRKTNLNDIIIRYYGTNSNISTIHRIRNARRLLMDSNFNISMPTVVYAHGYVELASDASVVAVVQAYQRRGGYNVLVLDWANLAFGNYIAVVLDVKPIGMEAGKALATLIDGGLSLEGLHLVGHSLGAHLLAFAARYLASRGLRVPRLTALDPAYPGLYPALLATPISPDDARFVDAIHTDGGGFGAPGRVAQADFWPNGGHAKQPGCPPSTIPLTFEDFCSHWRSWGFYAESVAGGRFLARSCPSYDEYQRGNCKNKLVEMGLQASPRSKGNFYLRTAAQEPYALGDRGAN